VRLVFLVGFLCCIRVGLDNSYQQRVTVNAARSDTPTPRARAPGRATQQREQEQAAHAKEKRLRRRERLEQYNEEYRLREQQGLSPLLAPANSSSDEEEESDGGRVTPDRWNTPPPSPRAEEVAVDWYLRWARKRSPLGHRWRCQRAPRRR
jgi:hypothetical protein